jgi:hypothetical protein
MPPPLLPGGLGDRVGDAMCDELEDGVMLSDSCWGYCTGWRSVVFPRHHETSSVGQGRTVSTSLEMVVRPDSFPISIVFEMGLHTLCPPPRRQRCGYPIVGKTRWSDEAPRRHVLCLWPFGSQ